MHRRRSYRSYRTRANIQRSVLISLAVVLFIGVFLLAHGCSSSSNTTDSTLTTYTPTQNKALDETGNSLPPFPVVSMTPDGTHQATVTKPRPSVAVIATATSRG